MHFPLSMRALCAALLCGLALPGVARAFDAAPMLQFEVRFGGGDADHLQLTVRSETLVQGTPIDPLDLPAPNSANDELWLNGNPRIAPYVMPPTYLQARWSLRQRSRIHYGWNLPGTAGTAELDFSTPVPPPADAGVCSVE